MVFEKAGESDADGRPAPRARSARQCPRSMFFQYSNARSRTGLGDPVGQVARDVRDQAVPCIVVQDLAHRAAALTFPVILGVGFVALADHLAARRPQTRLVGRRRVRLRPAVRVPRVHRGRPER